MNDIGSKTIQPKMSDGYKHCLDNFTNRCSCVFPILLGPRNDVSIVFLNYWKIKNNIENVICNIRIYNNEGDQIGFSSKKIEKSHNDISIKQILNKKDNEIITGIASVEFISIANLGFTFPGIIALYKSGNNYSAVHSAGRIKNSEEAKFKGKIKQTNWTCKWHQGITPFFSVFNGSCEDILDTINVSILSPSKRIIASKLLEVNLFRPFSNKIIFVDELFDLKNLNIEKGSFIEVELPFFDVFPRMVCGNFFRESKFLEVTHSFENQDTNPDYLPSRSNLVKDKFSPSINPILTTKELDLKVIFFPTNCEGHIKGYWREGNYNETLLEYKKPFDWVCGGDYSTLKEINFNSEDIVKPLDIFEGKIPTRITTNYIYKVANKNSHFSTDISAGNVTFYYPPKRSSWGHGIIGGNYKSIILMTSFSHDALTDYDSEGKLTIYSSNLVCEKDFTIKRNSGLIIDINEILKDNFDLSKETSISWFYRQNRRTKLMSYWISYTSEGQITGDHAF